MNREDIRKLLGGYATGTLTPEEQQALFEEALDNQELFDALAREQSLRELLRDPAAKAQLLAALEEKPRRAFLRAWLWRPVAVASVMAGVAGIAVLVMRQSPRTPRAVATVAQMKTPAAPAATAQEQPKAEGIARAPAVADRAPARQKRPAPAPFNSAALKETAAEKPVTIPAPPAVQALLAPPAASLPDQPPGVGGAQPNPPPPRFAVIAGAPTADAVPFTDARALFYNPSLVPRASQFLDTAKAVPTAPPAEQEAAKMRQQPARIAASGTIPVSFVPYLGVRYSVLRKLPGGKFVEIDPAQPLKTGDAVKLKFEPNDSGYLTVIETSAAGRPRPVASRRVERRMPFETLELKFNEPGRKEFTVSFSRQPEQGFGGAIPPESRDVIVQKAEDARERATYVMNTTRAPDSQRVIFTIRLNCQ